MVFIVDYSNKEHYWHQLDIHFLYSIFNLLKATVQTDDTLLKCLYHTHSQEMSVTRIRDAER